MNKRSSKKHNSKRLSTKHSRTKRNRKRSSKKHSRTKHSKRSSTKHSHKKSTKQDGMQKYVAYQLPYETTVPVGKCYSRSNGELICKNVDPVGKPFSVYFPGSELFYKESKNEVYEPFETIDVKGSGFTIVNFISDIPIYEGENLLTEENLKIYSMADINIIKTLLDMGFDINEQNEKGNTAYHESILKNRYDITTFLLKNGASKTIVNNDGYTGIDLFHSKSIIKTRFTDFKSLIYSNIYSIIEEFITSIKTSYAKTKSLISLTYSEIFTILISLLTLILTHFKEVISTILAYAIIHQNMILIKFLVRNGADVNYIFKGIPLIYHAILTFNLEIVEILNNGKNKLNINFSPLDFLLRNYTPHLMITPEFDRINEIEKIIQIGAYFLSQGWKMPQNENSYIIQAMKNLEKERINTIINSFIKRNNMEEQNIENMEIPEELIVHFKKIGIEPHIIPEVISFLI